MRLFPAAGAALVLALAAHPARAEPSKEARAEALFKEGTKLLDEGKLAPACEKLAESRALAVGVGVTLYLADCYENIGRLALAIETFRAAESLARARRDKRAEVAAERASELEAKTPSILLQVTEAPNLVITLDDAEVPRASWSAPRFVDPGRHVVRATAPGRVALEKWIEPGSERRVVVVSLSEPTAERPQAVDEAPPPAQSAGTQKIVGGVLAVAGLVGLGIGGVAGYVALSKTNESNDGPCDANDRCDARGLELRDDAGTFATVSDIAFIAGALALAGGVTLWLTAPKASKTAALGPRGLAVSF